MARREPPTRRPDPVGWLRVGYTKTGPAAYASHRDLARAFERMFRRAGVPLAYSSGFSPHPRISHFNVAPTGDSSLAEFLELGLAAECDPEALLEALNAVTLQGVVFTTATPTGRGATAKELTASRWLAEFTAPTGLAAAATALLAAPTTCITRATGKGLKTIDVKPALRTLRVEENNAVMVLAHTEPLVRASDVLTALETHKASWSAYRLTRLAQGLDGTL
ncbi:MAG: TIGR03936 family radical SAM-associated protein [Propionibacteriaceae bacterium]|nr:TIGR03936 family radical SAM-associated protein [Propionibacteriaceae bacterium]